MTTPDETCELVVDDGDVLFTDGSLDAVNSSKRTKNAKSNKYSYLSSVSNSMSLLSSVEAISSRASVDALDGSRLRIDNVGRSKRCVTEEDVDKIVEGKEPLVISQKNLPFKACFESYEIEK